MTDGDECTPETWKRGIGCGQSFFQINPSATCEGWIFHYCNPDVDVFIWDLHDDEKILQLFEEYRDCISKMVNFLAKAKRSIGQRYPVIIKEGLGLGQWTRRAYYIAVMLQFGNKLFHILENEKIPVDATMRKKYEKVLDELKHSFESIILEQELRRSVVDDIPHHCLST